MSVWSAVPVDWCYQVQPSGLITTVYVRGVSINGARCVVCVAKLPTHLLDFIVAASAAG